MEEEDSSLCSEWREEAGKILRFAQNDGGKKGRFFASLRMTEDRMAEEVGWTEEGGTEQKC